VLPKGHIKVGEDPRCTAVREVAEESGVLARVEARAGTALVGHRKKRVIFFGMAYCGRTPRRSSERRRVAWRDYTRARRELSFEEARAMLSVAHRYLLDNTARIESG
jgi:ADP-ribose pyrophosphatase YjhB (NUDIX family)